MGILDEDLERVRNESDIVQVISGYTQLRRVGTRFTGLCPFHNERSGSFSVNAEQNLYYCFGCHAKGDVITFVREKEGLDFVGAVEWLAQKLGIELRYTQAGQGRERKRRSELQDLIGRAAHWYHKLLLDSPDAAAARSYLRTRGFTGDLVRDFQIGWAPDDWDALARYLNASNRDFVDSGLGLVNRRNRQQDWFRGRILFPIADVQGHPIGFGGRLLPGAEGAKYINSKDSVVYNKSAVLYGLDRAKSSIVNAAEVVICEGYTDVIGYHLAGVPRAVATCGTALTEEHVRLLTKFANRVVLSFDSDKAGQNAAARFYEWERKYNLDVRVVDLPDGADPGDLALTDPKRLADTVAAARPFLEFRVNRVLGAAMTDTVEGRARAAEAALDVVSEHPDPLVQDAYALQIADHTRMAPETIRAMLATPRPHVGSQRRSARSVPNSPDGRWPPDGSVRTDQASRVAGPVGAVRLPGQTRPPAAEIAALQLAVHAPDGIGRYVVADVFSNDRLAELFALLIDHGDVTAAIAQADGEDADLLYRLAVGSADTDPLDVACRLWTRFIEAQRHDRLRRPLEGFEAESSELVAEMRWFQETLEALQDPGSQEVTVGELLAWVTTAPKEVD